MPEGADDSDDGVLTPEELDVTDHERVREFDDNRYFVSLDEGPAPEIDAPASADDDPGLAAELDGVPETYGVALAAKTETGVDEYVTASNSVVETFERAVLWYASQVGDADTPPEDVLRILVEESDLDV
jgi:hypothetical protein